MTASSDEDSLSRGAKAVRALLDRHGIPKHRHSGFVGDFFELSRAAAHQRVSKSTAWTLEELSALADHFGETLGHLVSPTSSHSCAEPGQAIAATLCVGDARVPCRIWLRPGNTPSPADAFVALRTGGDHVVMAAGAVPAAHALHIARLEVDQTPPVAQRIAVLQASENASAGLCDHLRSAGLNAHAFAIAADLLNAASDEGFAAYVVDWAAGDPKMDSLLSAIRSAKGASALILLSDRKRATDADIAQLARVVVQHKAQVLEKPVQLPLLVSTLLSRLAS